MVFVLELVVSKSDPTLLLRSELSIIKGLFPNSKEEDKVDKPKDSSHGKDDKKGVLVVHRSLLLQKMLLLDLFQMFALFFLLNTPYSSPVLINR